MLNATRSRSQQPITRELHVTASSHKLALTASEHGVRASPGGHFELAIPACSGLQLEGARMTKSSKDYSQPDLDNRANQLNPEHDAYWQSRGEDERPADWEDRLEQDSRPEK